MHNYHSVHFFFLAIGQEPTTWPANKKNRRFYNRAFKIILLVSVLAPYSKRSAHSKGVLDDYFITVGTTSLDQHKLYCYIAGVFPATGRPFIGYMQFMVTWHLTMKLFPAKCHEWAILRKLWRQTGNSSLLPVKCWPLLHVITGISTRFSNFAFVLFCYITK